MLDAIALQNAQKNKAIFPFLVDAVLLCVKQQLALRGHRDDEIQFDQSPTSNEGNFVTILRLLANSNPLLKQYLTSGPGNVQYIQARPSKTKLVE